MKVTFDVSEIFSKIKWFAFFFMLIRVAFISAVFLYAGFVGDTAIKSTGNSAYSKDACAIRRQCRGNVLIQAVDIRKWTPRSLATNKEVYDVCHQLVKQNDLKTVHKLKTHLK